MLCDWSLCLFVVKSRLSRNVVPLQMLLMLYNITHNKVKKPRIGCKVPENLTIIAKFVKMGKWRNQHIMSAVMSCPNKSPHAPLFRILSISTKHLSLYKGFLVWNKSSGIIINSYHHSSTPKAIMISFNTIQLAHKCKKFNNFQYETFLLQLFSLLFCFD